MKTALVSDWWVSYSGSERVEEQILACYPDADLFTLVENLPPDQSAFLGGRKITTSFIQRLPWAKKHFRRYLPLMPFAVGRFDLSAYDLIISSSHAVAKGVRTRPGQIHICYCHTPIRYAWDLREQYLREAGLDRGIKGFLTRWVLDKIRLWDMHTTGVDHFIANSHFIQRRIENNYRRDAVVIHPPVDTTAFSYRADKEDFYLTVSRLVPYKKIGLIAEAFAAMPDKKLVIIGEGPEQASILEKAGPNVTFLGYRDNATVQDYMRRAKAFVFAAEEDFGIAPVEAQACGTPVIAYGKGGILDSVRGLDHSAPTGVFFDRQTPQALIDAVAVFENCGDRITTTSCRANAERFLVQLFRDRFMSFVENALMEKDAFEADEEESRYAA